MEYKKNPLRIITTIKEYKEKIEHFLNSEKLGSDYSLGQYKFVRDIKNYGTVIVACQRSSPEDHDEISIRTMHEKTKDKLEELLR